MREKLPQLGASLLKEDWEFSPLHYQFPTPQQRDELNAAIRYEYARESDSIRRLAGEYGKLPKEVRDSGSLMDAKPAELWFFAALPFSNCILWPEFFPDTPWLKIPGHRRASRVQDWSSGRPAPDLLRVNEWELSGDRRLPERGGRTLEGSTETLVLEVDWAAGNNSDILEAFELWLKTHRPCNCPQQRTPGTRANVDWAWFSRLATMRLLSRYDHGKADSLAVKCGLDIGGAGNALKARERVQKDLPTLFCHEMFAGMIERGRRWQIAPPSEVPISWHTVTERNRIRSR